MARPTQSISTSRDNPATILTALHIGASSVSILIAEKDSNENLTLIDFLEQPAPLADNVFGKKMIMNITTERVVSIIQGYQDTLRELGLDPNQLTRAVATNILHEATNHEAFLNRIRIACGIPVSMIDDGEMTRLIYLKTRRRIQHLPAMTQSTALVVHVGPGNTRALLFQKGLITRYTSYRMGAHRTREAIELSHSGGSSLRRVIREHVAGNLAQFRFDYSDVEIDGIVMIGYEIQSVSSFLIKKNEICSLKDFRKFTSDSANLGDYGAVKHYQLDYQTAEALVPALEINLALAECLELKEVHIPSSEYEHGLLQDLLVSRDLGNSFATEVLRSARILAERYHSDVNHGAHVGKLCEYFLSNLQDLHQLSAHDQLLLQVAAILHEIGTYVSARAHHKHSEYIILNSEIFGLDRLDVSIVALVSRYHRHSGPKLEHAAYAALDTEDRIRVCKLAAILRVADALERTHAQRVSKIEITRTGGKFRIRLPGLEDTTLERLAMQSKADVFEQVFGLEVIIEENL